MPVKSAKSRRSIELPAICLRALSANKERQDQERLLAGSKWKETGHVFTSTIGTPIDDGKIREEFNSSVTAAQLPKQRFHDLRHACISLLGAQGVQPKVIAEIVGHSDIRLTQNVYQHVYDEAKHDAADRMDKLLTQISGGPGTSVATKKSSVV